jgi:hypothetical protein
MEFNMESNTIGFIISLIILFIGVVVIIATTKPDENNMPL